MQVVLKQLKETKQFTQQLSAQAFFLQYYVLKTTVGGRIWVKVDFFFKFYVMSHAPGGKYGSRS